MLFGLSELTLYAIGAAFAQTANNEATINKTKRVFIFIQAAYSLVAHAIGRSCYQKKQQLQNLMCLFQRVFAGAKGLVVNVQHMVFF